MSSPVPGVNVNYPYGVRNSGYSAGYHTGEDRACPTGTPVLATHAGRVVEASTSSSWGSGYGGVVVISSNDNGTTVHHGYCHLSSIGVRAGQDVKAGERIGSVGSTGNSTGPHLHYEERTSPFRYNNRDRKPQFPYEGGGSDGSEWDSGDVYVEKLHRGQDNSDSVRRLQWRLAHHEKVPSRPPVTGFYGELTEKAVQWWQRNVAAHDPDFNDGKRLSNNQANRLFGDHYRVHERD